MEWIVHAATWVAGIVGQNTLGAIVSVVVAFLFKRWINQLKAEQQKTQNIARTAATQSEAAATSAGAAASNAEEAGRHAKTATDLSSDTNRAMEWLVTELVAKDEQLAESLRAREYLKERVDTAVAKVAYQAASRPVTDDILPDARETDPITITGRHRLQTAMIRTEREPE